MLLSIPWGSCGNAFHVNARTRNEPPRGKGVRIMDLQKANKKRRRNRFAWMAAIAAVVIGVLVVGGFAFNGKNLTTEPAFAADSKGLHTVAFDPEVDALPKEALCEVGDNGYIAFADNSIRSVKSGNTDFRQFGTAVSTPYKAKNDTDVTKETLKELCGNPTLLDQASKEMLLWTEELVPGADKNREWLNTIRASFDSKKGINGFVEVLKDGDEVVGKVVTEEYIKYAQWMNTVLLRFNEEGLHSPTSVRNWEQSGVNDPAKGLPLVQQAKDQESKPAWIRVLTDKNDKCLVKIGFNAEDKRIEFFNCVEPEKPSTPSTPKGGGDTPKNPVCTENCGTTPPPPPPPATCPPGTVGTPPVCKDLPSNDPSQNGNAPDGGGRNDNPGPGDVTNTENNRPPEAPRTNPPPPVQQPPVSTPDPTPPPAPEPEAPKPSAPETGCDASVPGVVC